MRIGPVGKSLGAVALVAALAGGGWAALAPASSDARAKTLRVSAPRDAVMVTIPGGVVTIGDDAGPADERPAMSRKFQSFLLDRTPVTVGQFAVFVRDTGYVTEAEKLGEGGVLDRQAGQWASVPGADWRRPHGPDQPAAPADHPVTQVSWADADAFCRAYGARLPTEFEWERAARLGQTPDGHVFKAGDPLALNGRYLANTWQGFFPLEDRGEDGFKNTSPVGAFGETPAGLTDMAGNVWEWTASYRRNYATLDQPFKPAVGTERVQRGGSFLCDPGFCEGFRVTARNHSTPETALMHVGFRCAADVGRTTATTGRLRPEPQA